LRYIYGHLKNLSSDNGFTNGSKPFLFQEVIDMGNEAVKRQEYTSLGTVTEFTYSTQVNRRIEYSICAKSQSVKSSFNKIIFFLFKFRLAWSFAKLNAIYRHCSDGDLKVDFCHQYTVSCLCAITTSMRIFFLIKFSCTFEFRK
jgi:hypothetical protein